MRVRVSSAQTPSISLIFHMCVKTRCLKVSTSCPELLVFTKAVKCIRSITLKSPARDASACPSRREPNLWECLSLTRAPLIYTRAAL